MAESFDLKKSKNYEVTSDHFFSIIDEIERKIPVNHWIIKGVYVWPMLRINMREALLLKAGEMQPSFLAKQMRLGSKIFKRIIIGFLSLKNINFFKRLKKTDFVLFSDGASDTKMGDIWYDKLLGPIYDELQEKQFTSLIFSLKRNTKKPYYCEVSSFEFFDNLFFFISTILSMLPFGKIKLEKYSLFEEIMKKYGLINYQYNYRQTYVIAYRIYLLTTMFKYLLKRIKPKACFIVSYYGYLGYAFMKACRESNIKSVEIQHGVQGGNHDAYNRWYKMPIHGYPELPAIFWNWTKEDKDFINEWANATNGIHQAFNGGHPSLKFWTNDSNEIVKKYDELINNLKNKAIQFDILVTLQAEHCFKMYWDVLVDVIQMTKHKIRWWLRHHPATAFSNIYNGLDAISSIKSNNVNYVEATNYPLYAWLRNIDLHLTVRSSVAIEAKMFGVKTLFISELAHDENEVLYSRTFDVVHTKQHDILNYLNSYHISKNKRPDINVDGDLNYFLNNYL